MFVFWSRTLGINFIWIVVGPENLLPHKTYTSKPVVVSALDEFQYAEWDILWRPGITTFYLLDACSHISSCFHKVEWWEKIVLEFSRFVIVLYIYISYLSGSRTQSFNTANTKAQCWTWSWLISIHFRSLTACLPNIHFNVIFPCPSQ
jgi:hypothetical protein